MARAPLQQKLGPKLLARGSGVVPPKHERACSTHAGETIAGTERQTARRAHNPVPRANSVQFRAPQPTAATQARPGLHKPSVSGSCPDVATDESGWRPGSAFEAERLGSIPSSSIST